MSFPDPWMESEGPDCECATRRGNEELTTMLLVAPDKGIAVSWPRLDAETASQNEG